MTNSKNSNLEDVSKGNDESAPRANDSSSNKKTRFNKSKSISEVFKELEFEDDESYDAADVIFLLFYRTCRSWYLLDF